MLLYSFILSCTATATLLILLYMSKLSELPAILTAYGDKLEKIIKEIQTLKDSIGDTVLPEAAQASLDRLGGLIQTVDDQNPDAP